MSEQNKDAEREKFEAWMHTYDFPPALEGEIFNDERYPNADCFGQFVYDDLATQRCWSAWQVRASLPVGVPDGYALVPVEPTLEMVAALGFNGDIELAIGHGAIGEEVIEQYSAMLAAAPTVKESLSVAPTVKAEQVDDRAECIADGLSVGMSQEEAEEFADKIAAPSLPAAGSAVEEVEVVAYLFIKPDGKLSMDAVRHKPSQPAEAVVLASQHERIVAALSAQQSAQDVSVPRLNKTREQWQKLDAKLVATGSSTAIFHAIRDAQQDIERLHRALLNGGEA